MSPVCIATPASSGNSYYKFTGKERDPETGLDYFGARYYQSRNGRFMTPDWDAKPITVAYANFSNPQSLNLYSYVLNNPTTTRDLDGHFGYSEGGAISRACNEDVRGCQGGGGPDQDVSLGGTTPQPTGREYVTAAQPDNQLKPYDDGPHTPTQQPGGINPNYQLPNVNNAKTAAYALACSHSVQGCTAGQPVYFKRVGFTWNAQIPNATFDPQSLPKQYFKDPSLSNMIFHNGSGASYYLTSFTGLFGTDVGHVVNDPRGVEAHNDHFGPFNPLHWVDAFLSLFINTRAQAGAGVREECSPDGGCQ